MFRNDVTLQFNDAYYILFDLFCVFLDVYFLNNIFFILNIYICLYWQNRTSVCIRIHERSCFHLIISDMQMHMHMYAKTVIYIYAQ